MTDSLFWFSYIFNNKSKYNIQKLLQIHYFPKRYEIYYVCY